MREVHPACNHRSIHFEIIFILALFIKITCHSLIHVTLLFPTAVHTTLQSLLPPSSYFRLNPYMSEDFELDEIRKEKWDQMEYDTEMYCRKNELKLRKAAETLLKSKMPHQKAADWLKVKRDMIG